MSASRILENKNSHGMVLQVVKAHLAALHYRYQEGIWARASADMTSQTAKEQSGPVLLFFNKPFPRNQGSMNTTFVLNMILTLLT